MANKGRGLESLEVCTWIKQNTCAWNCMNTCICVFFVCLHRFARSKLSSALDLLSVLVTCFPSWHRYHMVSTTMDVPRHSKNNNEQVYTTKNMILESTRYWVNYPWTCICYSQLISFVFCTYVSGTNKRSLCMSECPFCVDQIQFNFGDKIFWVGNRYNIYIYIPSGYD